MATKVPPKKNAAPAKPKLRKAPPRILNAIVQLQRHGFDKNRALQFIRSVDSGSKWVKKELEAAWEKASANLAQAVFVVQPPVATTLPLPDSHQHCPECSPPASQAIPFDDAPPRDSAGYDASPEMNPDSN